MNRNSNATFYVMYDEWSIVIVPSFDEACDYLSEGAHIYGYANTEENARLLMAECFHRQQTST